MPVALGLNKARNESGCCLSAVNQLAHIQQEESSRDGFRYLCIITIKAPGVFWRPPLTLPAEISLIHEVSDLFCGRAIGMLRKLSWHYAAAQKSGIFFCNKAVGTGRPLMNTINKEKMLFFQKMHYLSKKKCCPVFGPSKGACKRRAYR